MRKHGCTPSRRDKHVTPAAISPPGVARGRFVGGQQSGLAGCKPPPLFTRRASSCSSQGRRQGEPWGASPRPSAPTYLPVPPLPSPRHRQVAYIEQVQAIPHLFRPSSGGGSGGGRSCSGGAPAPVAAHPTPPSRHAGGPSGPPVAGGAARGGAGGSSSPRGGGGPSFRHSGGSS